MATVNIEMCEWIDKQTDIHTYIHTYRHTDTRIAILRNTTKRKVSTSDNLLKTEVNLTIKYCIDILFF